MVICCLLVTQVNRLKIKTVKTVIKPVFFISFSAGLIPLRMGKFDNREPFQRFKRTSGQLEYVNKNF